jgi:plastocyanin
MSTARRATIVLGLAILVGSCTPTMPGGGNGHMAPGHMDEMMGQRSLGDEFDAQPPIPDAREIRVEAGEFWFEPDRIEITAGEPVNITVTNTGGIFHDFVIVELEFALEVEAGETATGSLEVAEPGSYVFICSVPGHEAAGMRGTLLVR